MPATGLFSTLLILLSLCSLVSPRASYAVVFNLVQAALLALFFYVSSESVHSSLPFVGLMLLGIIFSVMSAGVDIGKAHKWHKLSAIFGLLFVFSVVIFFLHVDGMVLAYKKLSDKTLSLGHNHIISCFYIIFSIAIAASQIITLHKNN